jgi:hypothetical protein
MKYKKRLVEVEAVQWLDTPNSTKEVADFKPDGTAFVEIKPDGRRRLQIATLQGTVEAAPGDYIVKDATKKEIYVCNPETFHATYTNADTRSITDQDLPLIDRIWGSMWKANCVDYIKELTNANKGIRRLTRKVSWLTNQLRESQTAHKAAIQSYEQARSALFDTLLALESIAATSAAANHDEAAHNTCNKACEKLASTAIEQLECKFKSWSYSSEETIVAPPVVVQQDDEQNNVTK